MPELVVGSGILADERARIDKFHFPEVEIRNDDRDAILPRFGEIPERKEKKREILPRSARRGNRALSCEVTSLIAIQD